MKNRFEFPPSFDFAEVADLSAAAAADDTTYQLHGYAHSRYFRITRSLTVL